MAGRLSSKGTNSRMQAALFVTCLVDLMRPRVGFAAVKLLQDAGVEVHVPMQQTCCGQPAYNNGDFARAAAIARGVIEAFERYPYVIAPSGSCAGMLRHHFPRLFEHDPGWEKRARELAQRTYELTQFLVDVAGLSVDGVAFAHTVTYHDSCSCLREMQVAEQPRRLLRGIQGLELCEVADREGCCGFGGTFCVKYPEISTHMADRKIDMLEQTGAEVVLAADLGCLLNIAGRLSREGRTLRAYHIAEVLAGMGDRAAIGEAEPQ